MKMPFARAFALGLLARSIANRRLAPSKRRRCRLSYESWQRRRLVGAKGLRP